MPNRIEHSVDPELMSQQKATNTCIAYLELSYVQGTTILNVSFNIAESRSN